MHFCTVCQNMYYLRLSDNSEEGSDAVLVYYCRNCGHSDNQLADINENNCVLSSNIRRTEQNYNHIINEYTKLDPTLPRINTVLCPNSDCATNKEGLPREIIYIRYDDSNMKYIYLCSTCNTVWQTNETA